MIDSTTFTSTPLHQPLASPGLDPGKARGSWKNATGHNPLHFHLASQHQTNHNPTPMGHDVFVSHSSKDKPFADAVVAALERHGVRCWVAPRDILPGESWANSILKAIESSRLMVLIFSGNANDSPHIRREVERAVHREIPVAPIRVQDQMPENELEYFLAGSHWMDAITAPFGQHLDKLAQQVRLLLKMGEEEIPPLISVPALPIPHDQLGRRNKALPRSGSEIRRTKGRGPLVAAGAFVLLAIAAAVTFPQWQAHLRRLFASSVNPQPVVKAVDPDANKPATQPEPIISPTASQPTLVAPAPVVVPPLPNVIPPTATKHERLAAIRNLYLEGKLTVDQVHLANQLLDNPPTDLSEYDIDRLAEINNVLEGRLPPDKLDRAIASIETPQQMQDRLVREQTAREEQARRAKIDSLLATARENQAKGDGKIAIASLDQLLSIDPLNTEGTALKNTIQNRMLKEQASRDQAAKQLKVDSLLASARADLDNDNVNMALSILNELSQLDPQNAEAPVLKTKCEDKLAQEQVASERTTKINSMLATALADDDQGRHALALAVLDELLKFDPQNADAASIKRKIMGRVAVAQRSENQGKIDSMLVSARAKDDKYHYLESLIILDGVLRLDPQNLEAVRLEQKICGCYHVLNKIGDAYTNSIGMKFVYIPAGEFLMGSPFGEPDRTENEAPQHKVTLTKRFMLATTTVTQAQWKALMWGNPSHFSGDDLPVEHVSWNDALDFCKKLGEKEGKHCRLPTEAEWEYACRAGTTTAFNTGSKDQDLDRAGWYGANSGNKTHLVGQKKPNAWGLYDMHGNVMQWCNDLYGTYPDGDVADPVSPAFSDPNYIKHYHVLRGGYWEDFAHGCRSASRGVGDPEARSECTGFRPVLEFGSP